MAGEEKIALREWLKFMLDAGIPSSQATDYAYNFVENRIERNMLGLLSRSDLKDLGVEKVGDLLRIEQHGKKLSGNSKPTTERTEPEQVVKPQSRSIKLVAVPTTKKASAVGKVVSHYMRSDAAENKKPVEYKSVLKVNPPSQSTDEDNEIYDDEELYEDDDDSLVEKMQEPKQSPVVAPSAVRRRVTAPTTTSTPLNKEEVPVQRKRRVLPEHEGKYKIKMPSGTTIKTAKLVAEGKLAKTVESQVSSGKPKIFARLGSSDASLKSDEIKVNPVGKGIKQRLDKVADNMKPSTKTSFTVVGLSRVDPSNFTTAGGPKKTLKRPATSTQQETDLPSDEDDVAPYIGVLKDGGKHSIKRKKIVVSHEELGKSMRFQKESIKARLGSDSQVKITRTINSTQVTNKSSSVKGRLGMTADSTVSSSSDTRNSSISSRFNSKPAAQSKVLATVGLGGNIFSRLGR